MNRRYASVLASLLAITSTWPLAADEPRKTLLVSVDKDGRYALDGSPVDQQHLLAAIKATSGGRSFDLIISSSPQGKYEAVGKAIAVANEAGVSSIRLTTLLPPETAASQAK